MLKQPMGQAVDAICGLNRLMLSMDAINGRNMWMQSAAAICKHKLKPSAIIAGDYNYMTSELQTAGNTEWHAVSNETPQTEWLNHLPITNGKRRRIVDQHCNDTLPAHMENMRDTTPDEEDHGHGCAITHDE